jgi:hypothetical protein
METTSRQCPASSRRTRHNAAVGRLPRQVEGRGRSDPAAAPERGMSVCHAQADAAKTGALVFDRRRLIARFAVDSVTASAATSVAVWRLSRRLAELSQFIGQISYTSSLLLLYFFAVPGVSCLSAKCFCPSRLLGRTRSTRDAGHHSRFVQCLLVPATAAPVLASMVLSCWKSIHRVEPLPKARGCAGCARNQTTPVEELAVERTALRGCTA